MATELELLRRARERLMNPDHWCQNRLYTASAVGQRTCALGAILLISAGQAPTASIAAYNRLNVMAQKRYGRTMVGVNDDLDHEAVMDVYDLAVLAAAMERRKPAVKRPVMIDVSAGAGKSAAYLSPVVEALLD